MASCRPHHHKNKPWIARRKRSEVEYFLGFYATKEEAEEVERQFDEAWPSSRGVNGYAYGQTPRRRVHA